MPRKKKRASKKAVPIAPAAAPIAQPVGVAMQVGNLLLTIGQAWADLANLASDENKRLAGTK